MPTLDQPLKPVDVKNFFFPCATFCRDSTGALEARHSAQSPKMIEPLYLGVDIELRVFN